MTDHKLHTLSVTTLLFELLFLPVTACIFVFHWIIVHLGEKNACVIGRWIIVPLFLIRRNRITKNMKKFFGSTVQTKTEVGKIFNNHLKYISDIIIDVFRMPSLSDSNLKSVIHVDGIEHLQKARSGGNGVLLIDTHVGNWWYTRALLTVLGFPVANVSNRIGVWILERQL